MEPRKDGTNMRPAILFCRSNSNYKTLDCDVWDLDRNALRWPGGVSVVAHPPCRLWAGMRGLSTAHPIERYLAIWAVEKVQKFGGVLEHPKGSKLWEAMNLPKPGFAEFGIDKHGGFTICILQWWFGHLTEKPTWLYIVGCKPKELPEIPFKIGRSEYVVATNSKSRTSPNARPVCSQQDREHTPINLCKWLIDVAKICHKQKCLLHASSMLVA